MSNLERSQESASRPTKPVVKMRSSRPLKKKKKENTWAEAITEVLVRSTTKSMALHEIHEKIYTYKLKDIGMTKQDEKNLRTMLAQSTNTAGGNCPFYRVGDRPVVYALKDPNLTSRMEPPDGSDADSLHGTNEDSNGSSNNCKRKSKRKDPSTSILSLDRRNIDLKRRQITDKMITSNAAKRPNLYVGNALRKAQILSRRRTSSPNLSSPNLMPSFANLRNRPHLQQVHRSRSTTSLQKPSANSTANTSRRMQSSLDLETPSSVLTNTRLKSVINSATFSMLPASYQYQLIQLLPQVDRELDGNGVPRMTQTALNNEFFSQALQDWVTQLSEGEFTRETQARIVQEISKERSKISPWKEKFFEEYYGQKKELRRTRSRSHDATLADLSFEAQLSKFQHLVADAGVAVVRVGPEADGNRGNANAADSGSESDRDPDYSERCQPASRQLSKDPASKSVNRRKISKPFKRTAFNSGQPTTNLFFSNFGVPSFSKAGPMLHNRPNFQIRDEMYRSDSEASEQGELSDSNNSFHQHDDTDDDGESSDGAMNLGDDNLMDVDDDEDDSDSGRYERSNSDSVTVDHSYTRLSEVKKRHAPGDDRERRRPSLGGTPKSEGNTLVLRPRGSLLPLPQNASASEKAGDNPSVGQPAKEHPVPGEVIPTPKSDQDKQESATVSVVAQTLQPSVNTSFGESIIPRISATSDRPLSSPISPATVCTSAAAAGTIQEAKNDTCRTSPLRQTTSESAASLKMKQATQGVEKTARDSIAMEVPRTRSFSAKLEMVSSKTISSDEVKEDAAATKDPEATTKLKDVTTKVKDVVTKAKDIAVVVKDVATKVKDTSTQAKDAVSKDIGAAIEDFGASSKNSDIAAAGSPVLLSKTTFSMQPVSTSKPIFGSTQNLWSQHPAACAKPVVRPTSPILAASRWPQDKMLPSSSSSKSAKVSSTPANPRPSTQGNKRPLAPSSTTTSSPVKRTRTLAEIKAQMKAKRLAAATVSPVKSNLKSGPPSQPATAKPSVKIAQPVFCPHPPKMDPTPPQTNKASAMPTKVLPAVKSEGETNPAMISNAMMPPTSVKPERTKLKDITEVSVQPKVENIVNKTEPENPVSTTKITGKIILKIKAAEGKNYSVKVDTAKPVEQKCSTDSEDDEIVRKARRFSQALSSSGESGDDHAAIKDSDMGGRKLTENYSLLTQLALPESYTTGKSSVLDGLLKRTQKSPVFGEPAFEGLSSVKMPPAPSSNIAEVKSQPFVSDKPVIGFQDIPSCTALSSNAPSFVPPSAIMSVAGEAQKYRSTSQGKSLVQMQQLARTNRIHSDESEPPDSETEDDSTASATSSAAEDEAATLRYDKNREDNRRRLRSRSVGDKNEVYKGRRSSESTARGEANEEDSCSTSSNDDKLVISECICSCRRLVLCKGCGAYTHEECLSATNLCSLCV